MKIIRALFLIVAGFCLVTACENPQEIYNNVIEGSGHHHGGVDQVRWVTMKSTGLHIRYRVIGNGPVTIVFIPGFTNSLEIFQKQFEYFRHKARCIYIDLPGLGQSDGPEGIEYTMQLMGDAVYDVVKKEGVKKFFAVGFSMGIIVAGQFEHKHPGMIFKLVNLEGSFNIWPTNDEERQGLKDYAAMMSALTDEEKNQLNPDLYVPTSPQDLKDLQLANGIDLPAWRMGNIFYHMFDEEVNDPVGWTYPILCMYRFPVFDVDYQQLYFPDAEIEIMEGFGHAIQWENQVFVNELMWEFFTNCNF